MGKSSIHMAFKYWSFDGEAMVFHAGPETASRRATKALAHAMTLPERPENVTQISWGELRGRVTGHRDTLVMVEL